MTSGLHVTILTDKTKKQFKRGISLLVQKYDNEFVPPLSSRGSASSTSLRDCNNDNISDYIESMKSQDFIVVLDKDNKVVGFLSYVHKEVCCIDCNYVSTIIVDKDYREQGVAKELYSVLEKLSKLPIIVRTWSTNYKNRSILSNLGYGCIKTIKDDRGVGIDTLYFVQYQI